MGEKMSDKKEEFINNELRKMALALDNASSEEQALSICLIVLRSVYDQGYSDASKEMLELLILEKNKNEHIENFTTSKADLFKIGDDFKNE